MQERPSSETARQSEPSWSGELPSGPEGAVGTRTLFLPAHDLQAVYCVQHGRRRDGQRGDEAIESAPSSPLLIFLDAQPDELVDDLKTPARCSPNLGQGRSNAARVGFDTLGSDLPRRRRAKRAKIQGRHRPRVAGVIPHGLRCVPSRPRSFLRRPADWRRAAKAAGASACVVVMEG